MYIPKHFLNTNDDEALSFMQKYSFGTIVTSDHGRPIASHLPFLVRKAKDSIIISSHFAKANPQAANILENEVLIIFSEPHAYISPRHYEKDESVPTWNYISVHAYGRCKPIEDEAETLQLLEKTILNYEADYIQQWNNLAKDFKKKMMKGIVGFEMEVTELQFKNKLSQNKTPVEQQNIIKELSTSQDSNEVQIAEYMKLNFTK